MRLCLDSGMWREVSGTLTWFLLRLFLPCYSSWLQPAASLLLMHQRGQQTSHVRRRPWLYLGQYQAKQLTKNSFLCLIFPSKNFVLSWHTDYRKTEKAYRHCQRGKQILTEDKVGDRDNNLIMWWIIVLQMIRVCCLKRSELEGSRVISLLVSSGG